MYEPELDPVIVGKVIAENRIKKNMSQEVLSGLSAIGRTHLSAIERGIRKPTLETLYKISQALGVRMSELVDEIENRLYKISQALGVRMSELVDEIENRADQSKSI